MIEHWSTMRKAASMSMHEQSEEGTAYGSDSPDYGPELPVDARQYYRTAISEIEDGFKAVYSLEGIEGMEDFDLDSMLRVLRRRRNHVDNVARNYTPMNKSLVAPIPPPLDRSSIRGILAFREWNVDTNYVLKPLFRASVDWKEVMFADKIPGKDNFSGLYANSMMPDIVTTAAKWCGLVELLGHIEEHADGVLRAETAIIKVIYCIVDYESDNAMLAFGALEGIKDKYPLIPVYVVTEYQKRIILMREVLISLGIKTI